MGYQCGKRLPRSQAPRIRRTLLTFLAFVYLFVGLAHTISCTDEAVAAAIAVDMSAAPNGGSDEGGSKKSAAASEHCYACAPIVMPALAPITGPSAQRVKLVFLAPKHLIDDHLRLDTPPPKYLT